MIELDDQVIATDPETGDTTSEPVEALFDDLDLGLADVTVTLPDGTSTVIKTTANHPFWDQTTKAWTDAGYLTAGDQLQSINGRTITVHAVRLHQGPQHRFNLTITSKHTYYVLAGTTPVLVHNCGDAAKHSVDNLADELDENTFFHYTDEAGHASIMEGGVVIANRKNVAYFTQGMVDPRTRTASFSLETRITWAVVLTLLPSRCRRECFRRARRITN